MSPSLPAVEEEGSSDMGASLATTIAFRTVTSESEAPPRHVPDPIRAGHGERCGAVVHQHVPARRGRVAPERHVLCGQRGIGSDEDRPAAARIRLDELDVHEVEGALDHCSGTACVRGGVVPEFRVGDRDLRTIGGDGTPEAPVFAKNREPTIPTLEPLSAWIAPAAPFESDTSTFTRPRLAPVATRTAYPSGDPISRASVSTSVPPLTMPWSEPRMDTPGTRRWSPLHRW